jgi:RNA polymerase sigma-70 factor (ECF subfamily)
LDFRAELERYHRDSYTWALNCCGRDADVAEDVLHDAYVQVLEGRARFDGRSSFKTWLFGIIRRTAARHRRRSLMRRLSLRHSSAARSDHDPDPEGTLCRDETRRRLAEALARLPRRQREVMLLVFYHELSISEAAEVMGVSVGSARTHYHRGKQALRRLLQKEADSL